MFDLAAVKLRNAVQILRKDLITDFYKASDDDEANGRMIGIQSIVAADQLIGGIEQADYSWWQGNINTAESDRDLTWTLLNKMFYLTKKYGAADRATLMVMSEGVLQDYEETLTKSTETHSPLVQLAQLATKGLRQFDGGFEGFSFKNIPMIADPFCPAKKLFMLNEKYIHWRVLKNFEATGWTQLRAQGKDWAQNTIFGYGALTSSANRKQGMIEKLNEQ